MATKENVEDKSSQPDKTRTSLLKEEDLILFEKKEYKKSIYDICLTLEKCSETFAF